MLLLTVAQLSAMAVMGDFALSLMLSDDDNSTYPGMEPAYLLAEKIVAGAACIFSVFGALLVIFSFTYDSESRFSIKELYYKICCGYTVQEKDQEKDQENEYWVTKYEMKSYNFILINLSIADIIVALSHFWGLLLNLEHKFSPNVTQVNESAIANGQDVSCTTQGAFTALSTQSSFFWTDILAVYLAFNIVFKKCTNNKLAKLDEDYVEREDGSSRVVVVGRE